MAQDHIPEIVLDRLRTLQDSCVDKKDLQRIERDIEMLSDKISALAGVISASRPGVDVKEHLQPLSTLIERINGKVPPLAQTIAVAAIVVGLLGVSYIDVRKSSQVITDMSTTVTTASTEVQKKLIDMTTAATSAESLLTKLTTLSEQFSTNIEKIKEVDSALASVIEKVAKIPSAPSKSSANADTEGAAAYSGNPSENVAFALLEALGDQAPKEMILLRDAMRAMDDGRYDDARELLKDAKAMDPNKKISLYDSLTGDSYFDEGDYEKAIGAYKTALDLDPESSATWNNLGSSYFAQGAKDGQNDAYASLMEKSAEAHRKSIEIEPSDPVPYVNLTIALNAVGKHQEALNELLEFKGEGGPEINYQMAATYSLLDQKAMALDALSRTLDEEPSRAILAATDSDFQMLRTEQSFLDLLRSHMGEEQLEIVRKMWQSDTQ